MCVDASHAVTRLISLYLFPVQTGLFINNEFVSGAGTIDTVNPATGEVITAVQAGKATRWAEVFEKSTS